MPILKNISVLTKILTCEMEILKRETSTWVYVREKNRKELKKGSLMFYFLDVIIDDLSLPFVYDNYNPFSVRDGDNLELNQKYNCYCTFVKSPIEFTLVFENYVPFISKGKLNKANPSGNIQRQILLLDSIFEERKNISHDLNLCKSNNYDQPYKKSLCSFYSFLLTFPVSASNLELRKKLVRYGYLQNEKFTDISYSNQSLTPKQKEAISKSLCSEDFYLIHGPPGTGKTTVITDIVLNLVAKGKKVLICSWMNVAIDNILSKLLESNQLNNNEIARIGGGAYKVSKDVQIILVNGTHFSKEHEINVVGSTLASAYSARNLIDNKLFDVVIVDEAGASTVPQTLLALGLGRKFILVGDHYQLPPILQVTSEKCGVTDDNIKDIKLSLFEKMIKRWPDKVTVLDTQYRMDKKIAEMANILIYKDIGGIKTGINKQINYLPACDEKYKMDSPSAAFPREAMKLLYKDFPVVFLNVDGSHQWDKKIKSETSKWSAFNYEEVEIVYGLYRFLIESIDDLKNEKIGIITTYRKQVEKLTEKFGTEILQDLEINTVDSFQGKEKDIIIFSTVYSKSELSRRPKYIPNIFKEIRRYNVAFTRAKYKLIIVGDVELFRYDIKHFHDIHRYINHVYGDPNNNELKSGIIKNQVVNEFLLMKTNLDIKNDESVNSKQEQEKCRFEEKKLRVKTEDQEPKDKNEEKKQIETKNLRNEKDETQNKNPEPFTKNSIGMEFVLIPSGKFNMGSKECDWAKPVHPVKISKPFYIGKYPVTQREWITVMGTNPSYFNGDDRPVERVSWDDVQQFIKKLNEKEDTNKYRLSSEAEWEYACRGGTTTEYSFGDMESKLSEYAWYQKNSEYQTQSVGNKKPNPWDLYDMHGNVLEWVQDKWHDSYKGAPNDGSAWEDLTEGYFLKRDDQVKRGGSCNHTAGFCRSAVRDSAAACNASSLVGFRLVKEV